MLVYRAMYKNVNGGVHAEVLDFPGAITFGKDLDDARSMLAAALVDMAETHQLGPRAAPAPRSHAQRSGVGFGGADIPAAQRDISS